MTLSEAERSECVLRVTTFTQPAAPRRRLLPDVSQATEPEPLIARLLAHDADVVSAWLG